MRTLDPSIRQAAQRVTAWHIARWRAHVEPADSTLPQPPEEEAGERPPVVDPKPGKTAPVQDPPPPGLAS
jgi:hypothetical protein